MDLQPFQKIALGLERRIRGGTYASGSALPSRLKLMSEFGVARATLDRAIRELIQRGLLVSRHGSGTYVLPPDTCRYHIGQFGWSGRLCGYPPELRVTSLVSGEFFPRSERRNLLRYDGLLWIAPESADLEIIRSLSGQVAQVVVNRITDGVPFVSIDYRSAYREITYERIQSHPDCRLVFLRTPNPSLAVEYRLEGFLDACRSLGKYYEIIELPGDFSRNCKLLQARLQGDARHALVIVSDALHHTGSVMGWQAEQGGRWEWGRNLFYSDFDDGYPSNVWGVSVTSFLQDLEAMSSRGAEVLLSMISSGRTDGVGELVSPQRKSGDT